MARESNQNININFVVGGQAMSTPVSLAGDSCAWITVPEVLYNPGSPPVTLTWSSPKSAV